MTVTFRPYVPEFGHQSLLDSQALMAASFSDPSGTSREFLEWLYLRNPFRKAVGSIAYDGDTPVSQLFLTFQQASFEGRLSTVAVMSNGCTAASHRGQGHFYKLFTLLVEEAKKLDVPFIWAYPNPLSFPFFIKTGFHIVKQCELELAPVSYLGILNELMRKKGFSIDASTEDVPVDVGAFAGFSVSRADIESSLSNSLAAKGRDSVWHVPLTPVQLRWRYLEHPTRSYYACLHEQSGVVVLLRFVRLFGMTTGLVMKSNASSAADYNRMLKDLRKALRGEVNFLTTLPSVATRPGLAGVLQARFVIPGRVGPRKFPLAVFPVRGSLPLGSPGSFDFVLGDYEAL